MFTIRPANSEDIIGIRTLIQLEPYVQQHLDWYPPTYWVGKGPFLVAERNKRLVGALACTRLPGEPYWIRLFAASLSSRPIHVWPILWEALAPLLGRGPETLVASIAMHPWFVRLITEAGFQPSHEIVVLHWRGMDIHPPAPKLLQSIHPMLPEHLPEVTQVDAASFAPLWHNAEDTLGHAFRTSAFSTVYVAGDRIAGYQISTGAPGGGHLARLAVLPEFQGAGIGYALVYDLVHKFAQNGVNFVSVNTQSNNASSLALYQKAGFFREDENYPVYVLES